MTSCKNCTNEFEGKYCPDCGQKASTKRFSTKILFSQLLDKILPLNRGVLFTARHLLTRPGHMLREYLDGKRAGYSKPLQFLLIISAISLIFFSQGEFEQGMKAGFSGSEHQQNAQVVEFQQKIGSFVSSHLTLVLLGMIPFLALVGRWFYKKHDVNYAEHFVMNCYLLGASSIIVMPFMAGLRVMGENAFSPSAALFFGVFYIGYFIWAHITFFREPNRIWNGTKALLTYLIAYLMYILAVGLLSAIAMLFLIKMGPKG